MAPKRFLGLDGLRGVCALTVLLFHCNNMFHKGSFYQHGYLAVDVFFILSGFVIALTYEDRMMHCGERRKFLVKRAQTLFPIYWLGAALNVALFVWMASAGYLAQQDTWWMVWLFVPMTTMLLVPDFLTSDGVLYPAMNSGAWSLFIEWMAYFLYAANVSRWKTSALAALVFAGWGAMAYFGYHSGFGWCVGAQRSNLLTLGVLRCLPAFAAGVVIYRIHRHPLFLRLPDISTEVLLALWMGVAVFPTFSATPTFDALTVTVFSPILVCLLIRSDHKAPTFCRELGALSYPLYVVHPGILVAAQFTPVFGLSHGPRPWNAVLVVLLCLTLAWCVKEIAARLRWGRASPGFGETAMAVAASPAASP